jgi:transcriptional regulator with XRE-family HTH domain
MHLQEVLIANIRKFRKKCGLTQEKLAELCDTDPCYIRQIETGRRCPSLPYIERIANALEVAPHSLFYNDADFPPAAKSQKQELKEILISRVSKEIEAVVDTALL